ncbi:DMT family transporter [Nocardia sp. alder85J]|uniref:DMT family transporter n=1 Tax=Nocardia sp. alder85J TaxID=2862949 RepID=UPI001CD435B6|nr:DMT family transporter [Nocardia sp. alder85J]MCX4096393.1 DMT family transporter [Nocardia sp. alder85J]
MRTRTLMSAAPAAFVLMWSSAFIAGIIGVGAAPPMVLLFGRFGSAGLALAVYAVAVHAQWPRGRQLLHAVVAGLLMQIVQFGAFYTAMTDHVSAAVVSLIQGLNPVVIALFAGRVLGETVTRRQWLGFAVGGVGVGLAVLDQSAFSVSGLLLCFVGLLGLSLGTVYQKRFTPEIDSRSATAVHALASAPVAGLLAWAYRDFHIVDTGRFAGALVWMVLVNAMGAFLLLNAMLRRWDTTRVGKLFFATPAVTAIMAWLVVGQPLHPLTLTGLAVGVVGMVLAARRSPAPRPAPADSTPIMTLAVPQHVRVSG